MIQKTEVGVIERFIPGTITKKSLKFVEFETNSKIFSLDQPAYCRYKNNPAGSWPVGIQYKVSNLVLNNRLSTESLYALLCKSDKAQIECFQNDFFEILTTKKSRMTPETLFAKYETESYIAANLDTFQKGLQSLKKSSKSW